MNITERNIILGILEIESGRHGELVDKAVSSKDTNGGYNNYKEDIETNWGVTINTLRGTGSHTPIKALTLGEAYEIYENGYYIKSGANRVISIHPYLAKVLTNAAIHMGHIRIVKILQSILNLHNNRGTLWPDIIVDGGLGNKSMTTLKAFLAKRRGKGSNILITEVLIEIGAFYHDIETAKESKEIFTYGWSTRVYDLMDEFFIYKHNR